MKGLKNITRNPKTTFIGVLTFITAGLVSLNVVTPEQATAITGALVGILGLIAKDNSTTGTAKN